MPFFADLNEKERAELLTVARFKHLKKGETLFLVGDAITHLYWICAGAIQEYRETPDGHELTASIDIVGDLIFEPDAMHNSIAHTMNAKAMQSTSLLTVPLQWIQSHIRTWDHMADKIISDLAKRAQSARIETEHQSTMNAAQIIACFLQQMCVVHNFDPRNFTLPYTKSIIASRLGMELESFSRALPRLRDLGITVNGKQVTFTDISLAQKFSCGACSVNEECPTHQSMKKLLEASKANTKLEVA